jgi:glycosyltransferase involved in cell wall biosynthesis
MPAFNAEAWIGESVKSVLGQSHSNLQLIVVDDGSTDSTYNRLDAFSDSRVVILSQENRRAAAARNRAMEIAEGDFVQFLDADDLLSPEKIGRQIAALRETGPRSIASCAWGHFTGNADTAEFSPEPVWSVSDPTQWLMTSLSGGGMMQTAAWLTPRELIDEAGPWNESLTLHDDGEYFSRVLLIADRNVFVSDAKVFYRGVSSSLSRQRSSRDITSAYLVCELRHRHLLAKVDSPESRKAVATQYAQFVYEHGRADPELARKAIRAINNLGASPNSAVGGDAFRVISSLIGFDQAIRLRSAIGGLIG